MRHLQFAKVWFLLLLSPCNVLKGCRAAANQGPNGFANSTTSINPGSQSDIPSTGQADTVTEFILCFTTATQTLVGTPVETTFINSTVTTIVTIREPPRIAIRATTPISAPPSIVTITECSATKTFTVIITLPPTQKITVNQLVTETQTVIARPLTTSSSKRPSSTSVPLPPQSPVAQITPTSSLQSPSPITKPTTIQGPPPAGPGPVSTTIGGKPVAISTIPSGGLVVDGETLSSGQVITSNELILSNGPTGLVVSTADISVTQSPGAIIASIVGITALPSGSGVVIDGGTLTSGGTLVVSGTTYILPTGGTVPAIVTPLPSSISIGIPEQGSGVVIDGKTLTQGGTIVVSGSTYLLPAGATVPVAIGPGSFTTTGSGAGATQRPANSSSGPGFVQAGGAFLEKKYSPSAGFVAIVMGMIPFLFSF